MKTLVSKIVVIVALMCATSMNAQNNNQFDAQLKKLIKCRQCKRTYIYCKGNE